MTKGVLSELNETTQKLVKNKNRKSLQILQVSADDQELTDKNMVHPDEETVSCKKKQLKAAEKVIVAEKENEPVVRRSKRKTAVTDKVNYTESPDESKISRSRAKNAAVKTKLKKFLPKPKKGHSTLKKSDPRSDLNQTKLNFSPATSLLNKCPDVSESANAQKTVLITSPSSEVTEDSGFDPSTGVCEQSLVHSIAVIMSPDKKCSSIPPDDETSILTSVNPPLCYWKDLAEQRRMALEKVLHENELLHDQLTVLEAENSQLKQLVKEAENLAQVLRGIIE